MALSYKIVIKITEPTETEKGLIWINPTISQAYILLGDWVQFVSGGIISSYTEGLFDRTLVKQELKPTPEIGLIWVNNITNQAYIYLDDWYSYVGG